MVREIDTNIKFYNFIDNVLTIEMLTDVICRINRTNHPIKLKDIKLNYVNVSAIIKDADIQIDYEYYIDNIHSVIFYTCGKNKNDITEWINKDEIKDVINKLNEFGYIYFN